MQELAILKHFLMDRGTEYRFYQNIKKVDNLEKTYKVIYEKIDELYQLFPEMQSITADEIKAYLVYRMPGSRDMETLDGLIDMAFDHDVGPEITELMLQQLAEKHIAGKIVNVLMPVLEGTKYEQIPKAMELATEYNDLAGALTTDHALTPCTDTLKELMAELHNPTGFTWPLTMMQDAMGDAQPRTSGMIFARPETGKTSLGLHLAAHWAQLHKDDPDFTECYFGCEEDIKKYKARYLQAILGAKEDDILGRMDAAQAAAEARGANKCMFFGGVTTTRHIEQLTKEFQPKAIFIDQTPKIYQPGMADQGEVRRLQSIFQWVRNFCKEKDLIGVNLMQAAASAENKQWLQQIDLNGSKTDVPGELDWMLGVGKVHETGMEYARFLSLCRNKNGSHSHKQCYFDFDRCRYYDSAPKQKGTP